MINVYNIYKKYGELQVLNGVSLAIEQGEVISIVGSSGAGKTTLLQIMGSLDRADSGTIEYDGTDISLMNANKLAEFRNQNIGFVFQFHHLLPEFNAMENIAMPALIKGESKEKAEQKAIDLLEKLDLKSRIHHKPSELSGGEQQRVATARALINQPKVIFADEPSGNLDSKNAAALHQLFFDLRSEFKQTFVIVTHNDELAQMCDKTYRMKDGGL